MNEIVKAIFVNNETDTIFNMRPKKKYCVSTNALKKVGYVGRQNLFFSSYFLSEKKKNRGSWKETLFFCVAG